MSAALQAEVVVVGGGAAGLAAAVALARSRREVVVVDAGQPRNAPADGAHNLLGQEGIAPLELLARGRAEARAYGVRVVDGLVTGASGTLDDFALEVDGGALHVRARRVVLATGLVDELPELPGVREAWGRSVLHCPFCHGWEVRGQRIAVLGRDERALHQVLLFRRLSDDVTLFLHEAPEPDEEQWEQLAALGVSVVTPRVERLVVEGAQVRAVELEGGRAFAVDAVVVAPRFAARTGVYEALGGRPAPTPLGVRIEADERGATAVPGVRVAGNAAELTAMVAASTASGVQVGAAVHGELAAADLARAVRERRAPFPAAVEARVSALVPGDRRHGL
ncbi:NAD(P)/FAD-dependent oxidoreductase [Kineococcus sp. SYSU DK006]|uniref:NAD(P)/FAD-dependent oxidoreductase n=1 Tax=Kineococcus sp. SYSU DK006 TaxID=3383127 RepID=UPI003D7E6C20